HQFDQGEAALGFLGLHLLEVHFSLQGWYFKSWDYVSCTAQLLRFPICKRYARPKTARNGRFY
ncbi:hypothetical protein K3W73_14815, partial [Listeria monocytogenes]|nr:hypothetical protein [Listeria monocytogenes]